MKRRRLNYRFHNPNPEAVTTDCILKACIEANTGTVETAVRKAAKASPDDKGGRPAGREGHSA